MKKHFDNKRDLIAQMRETKRRADNAVAATFTAYMLVAATTLYEDLGFRDKRIIKFIDGFYKRLELYEDGKLSVDDMEADLLNKAGVVIERPHVR